MLRLLVVLVCIILSSHQVCAWKGASLTNSLSKLKRVAAAAVIVGGLSNPALADMAPSPWLDKLQYEVLKAAATDAAKPKAGDLVAIRFSGSYNSVVFDDTFNTADPYYYR